MKGCLKQPSRAPSPTGDQTPRKTVVFDADGLEQIFVADEWDRTPTEPARNLSYHDILELKEIQRSLPRAQQPADLIGGKPAAHYLSTVPIGLLPLLPEAVTPPPPPSSIVSTLPFPPTSWRTVRTPAPSIPPSQTSTWHPAHLGHLPAANPPINRPKPRFAFLPLLETSQPQSLSPSPQSPSSPQPSERSTSPDFAPSDSDVSHDPPTPSLTNASLDSSPLSRASSCSPEPPFFQLPPSKHLDLNYTPVYTDDNLLSSDGWISDPQHIRRPAFGASSAPVPIPASTLTTTTPKRKKKKNVIFVNDMEIELDDDDDDDEDDSACDEEQEGSTPPAKAAPSIPFANSSPSPRHSSPTSPSKLFPSRSPPTPSPSCHTPIRFKRNTPSPPVSTSPTYAYVFRQGSPTFGSARNSEASSPPKCTASGGCSSPVLVPSA